MTVVAAPQKIAAHRPRPRAIRAVRAARGGPYYLLNLALVVLFLFPLAAGAMSSIKSPTEANQSPPTLVPHSFSGANYRTLVTYGSGLRVYLVNSLLVSLMAVLGTIVVATLGGYAFARFRFPLKNLLFFVVLAILMVPYPTLLIPLYILLGKIHLQNSLLGLSVVLIMFQLPFATYMMRNSFDSVPKEFDEAALMDGCNSFTALFRVLLPIVVPGIVTVGLFAFLASWNEFLAPLIFLTDSTKYTLPVMLVNVRSGAFGTVDLGALQAGIVIAMLPCVVVFLALQRFYVSGLAAGGVKG